MGNIVSEQDTEVKRETLFPTSVRHFLKRHIKRNLSLPRNIYKIQFNTARHAKSQFGENTPHFALRLLVDTNLNRSHVPSICSTDDLSIQCHYNSGG